MVNKEQIKYAITAYVPGSQCNLRCKYCYISNCVDENHIEKGLYKYDTETMVNAFSPERLGGIADIGVIGAGETLLADEVVPFVHGLLKQGHLVEVVTNLTLNNRIDELLDTDPEDLKRLVVKGSLHWLELKRLNKIDDYFNNMKKVLSKGASSYPFLVLCDDYMPYIDEIRQTCLDKIGALPHCSPSMVFEEKTDIRVGGKVQTSPECDEKFVKEIKEKFDSKIFDMIVKFLDVDVKRIFCYAGQWSFCVGIGNGAFFKCHACPAECNFFENINKMPDLMAVGSNCQVASCSLQYNFTSYGFISELNPPENFGQLLERPELFNETVRKLRNFKFTDFKTQYPKELHDIISKEIKNFFYLISLKTKLKHMLSCKK